MSEEQTDFPVVSCEICLTEIPASEARSAEANDYVAYFCGLECYKQWRDQSEPHQPPTKS